MITDEERREVAKRLRGLPTDMYGAIAEWEKTGLFIDKNISDEADYRQIHNAVFGCFPAEHMNLGDYEELHERIADLIDPTCYLVGTTSEEGLYGPTVFRYELSCGHTFHTDCPEPPAYCYECGCRVVEKDKDDDQ